MVSLNATIISTMNLFNQFYAISQVVSYHAGLSDSERTHAYKNWMKNDIKVVLLFVNRKFAIATDLPNVYYF